MQWDCYRQFQFVLHWNICRSNFDCDHERNKKKIYCSAQIDFDVIFLLIRTFQCIYFFQSWRHKSNFNLWKFMWLYNSCWLNWQQIAWIYERMNKRKTIQFRKLWVCSRNHQSGNLFTVSSCVRLDLLNKFIFSCFRLLFLCHRSMKSDIDARRSCQTVFNNMEVMNFIPISICIVQSFRSVGCCRHYFLLSHVIRCVGIQLKPFIRFILDVCLMSAFGMTFK